ncbi:SdpI family protein [Roseimicrobium sp. ORNL1]|uniref:SdpI family protein n=1 Tax=Roseimicrobium sp. ORNL1 TaxID=2711231 RepID=UPI0013E14E25|nr:SdpI family protein [Roseimicrobium sp. ORNL1]QIF04237.1 DUF1648 domain-containing protein [Roseimicrobium sp. ORNL1]
MKTMLKREWLLLLVIAAPFVFLAAVWPQIPERIPIHFNASFVPDGWMKKPWGALLLPLTSPLMVLITRLWFRFDPKMAKCDPETREHVGKVLHQVLVATCVLFGALSVAVIWAAWGDLHPVIAVINYGIPLMFLVVGNSMSKLRPNYTIGIRVPWTLESPVVWTKTHRFGGRLMVALGLGLLVAVCFGLEKAWYAWVLLAGIGVWAVAVIAYSFILSRRETRIAM